MKRLIIGAVLGAAAWAIYRTATPPAGSPSGWSPQQIGKPGDYTLEGAAAGAVIAFLSR